LQLLAGHVIRGFPPASVAADCKENSSRHLLFMLCLVPRFRETLVICAVEVKMTNQNCSLSLQEAYLSMFEFIVELYRRTNSYDLGAILGDLSLLANGTTADPAAWNDWIKCVDKARKREVDANLVIISDKKFE
jgi:hypothetical protein